MMPESFCHVTTVPLLTVRDTGLKVVEFMQKVLAGQLPPPPPPPPPPPGAAASLPPHDAITNPRAKTAIKLDIFRILPPRRTKSLAAAVFPFLSARPHGAQISESARKNAKLGPVTV